MSTETTTKLDLSSYLLALVHVPDPAERLRRLAATEDGISELADRLRALKRDAILELRRADPLATWQAIGDLLGVSAQRAEQLSRT